jgi:hypothetical protein
MLRSMTSHTLSAPCTVRLILEWGKEQGTPSLKLAGRITGLPPAPEPPSEPRQE